MNGSLWAATSPILALAADTPSQVSFLALLMGLLGGLALFLAGMDQMAEALKAVAGSRMRGILAKLTSNRFMGVLTGALVTAVIQSSSVTTVLVVGFVTAGLISMAQSVGVIMGANIGTTITAQIIAFKITKYALAMIAVGFGMVFFGKREQLKQYGAGLMGLGLVFFGMSVMGDAMAPLRSYPPFLDGMTRMENPIIGILVGAVFTALVQSSSATTGIVIVLASQGFLALAAGIAIVFGANVGTCVTAMLASIGKPREAVRAAVVHVLFNLAGVLIWIPFIDQLAWLVESISPSAQGLAGSAKMAAETPRQIANAHTIFNVANTMVFLPFAGQFARVAERLVPDRPLEEDRLVRAKYLDRELLNTPSLALDRARLEILHLGDRVMEMLRAVLPAVLNGSRETLDEVESMDDAVDALHGYIVTYLGEISQKVLTKDQTQDFLKLMEATNDLENIGDIIETNLVTLGRDRIQEEVTISQQTQGVITDFHAVVTKAVSAAMQAVTQNSETAAGLVIDMKREINRLSGLAAIHQAERLVAKEPNRLPAYTIEMDILENLKRIFYFAKRMARVVVPSVALRDVS